MLNLNLHSGCQTIMVKKLLVDAFVAKTEAGKMEKTDFDLVNNLGIVEDIEAKCFERAGDKNPVIAALIDDPDIFKLAWER